MRTVESTKSVQQYGEIKAFNTHTETLVYNYFLYVHKFQGLPAKHILSSTMY